MRAGGVTGWVESALLKSTDPDSTYQVGKGAVALVFSWAACRALLACPGLVCKFTAGPPSNWKCLDGFLVDNMNRAGWREYVHVPSLAQHTGSVSTIGNGGKGRADTFPGADFDALTLLNPGGSGPGPGG
jgi:hypothetical protein